MRLGVILATQPKASKFGALKSMELDGKMCVVGPQAALASPPPTLIRLRLNGSCSARHTVAAAIILRNRSRYGRLLSTIESDLDAEQFTKRVGTVSV
ncbi:hypothetical protein D3C87_1267600 [compost metagenome]